MKLQTTLAIVFFIIGISMSVCFALDDYKDTQKELQKDVDKFILTNLYINSDGLFNMPRGIIFTADYITFKDNNLTLTFNNSFHYDLNVDYITFNIANETYKFVREK